MKHHRLYVVSALCFGLLSACGRSDDATGPAPSGAGGLGDPGAGGARQPELPPRESTSDTRGSACDSYPCFTACGKEVAVAAVEPAFGFTSEGSIPWGVRDSASLASGQVLTLDMQAAVVRSGTDFGVIGRASVPGTPFKAAVAEHRALLQSESAALVMLDVSSSAEPRVDAWWFAAGAEVPNLWLVGAVGGRFVVRTRGGASFVEVSEDGPREAFCLERPESSEWTSLEIFGDVLAIADSIRGDDALAARLYRVTEAGATEWASFPLDQEQPFTGAGSRLAIAADVNRRLALYDLSGSGPVLVAEASGLPQSSNRARAIGGFAVRGEDDEVGYDLLESLEAYDLEPISGSECLWRATSGTSSFVISPVQPDQRWAPDAAPEVVCPDLYSYHETSTGALSPDGERLLFDSGIQGHFVLRDLSTGVESPVAEGFGGQSVFWIGDHVVTGSTRQDDYGLTVESWLDVSAAAAPGQNPSRVASPGPFISQRATQSELWVLSYGENYVYGGDLPESRVLWRLDPGAQAVAPAPLEGVELSGVERFEVAGDAVYLVTQGELHVVDRSGATLARAPLPSAATSTAASALGFFMTDGAGRLWSSLPGTAELIQVTQCPGCRVRGAGGARVYVTTLAPVDARHQDVPDYDGSVVYSDLLAYQVSPAGSSLMGRYHLPEVHDNVLIGPGRVVALSGTVVSLEPPPAP